MTFGSLFSGIGGLDLGLERAGMECRWQVEIDPFCTKVLERHWPNVKRYGDIQTVSRAELERVDCVAGGFPCTDISSAGKRAGLQGEHSGLWREMLQTIRVVRPRIALVENVADITHRGLDEVLGGLAGIGYDAEWDCLPACAFDSPQPRWRAFIIAHLNGGGCEIGKEWNRERSVFSGRLDYDRLDVAQRRASEAASIVRGMGYGFPGELDRIKSLGNAVVPQVAEWLGRRILDIA